MKKIALIIAVALCGSERLQATGNENIQKLNSTNQKIKEISSTLESNQNTLERALQDMITSIENNSQWYEMNISFYTGILKIIADENKGNADILRQVQNAQSQLDQISKSLKALQSLEAPLKAAQGPVSSAKEDIDQVKQSLTQLDGYVLAIESQVPPMLCKNYSGTEVEGFIEPSCLVPSKYGVVCEESESWRKSLWDKYYMQMPERRRQSVERSVIVKKA